jgi:hypothetical protein
MADLYLTRKQRSRNAPLQGKLYDLHIPQAAPQKTLGNGLEAVRYIGNEKPVGGRVVLAVGKVLSGEEVCRKICHGFCGVYKTDIRTGDFLEKGLERGNGYTQTRVSICSARTA